MKPMLSIYSNFLPGLDGK